MRRPSSSLTSGSLDQSSSNPTIKDNHNNNTGGGGSGTASLELSIYIKTQLSAVRGLTKLSQHPSCRSLIVDHCLEELVALAVGAQSVETSSSLPSESGTQLVRSDSGCGQSTLTDPLSNAEDELRLEAENVIIALGFGQGYKDIELCFNDATLLAVWFHHKRSLQHQAVARWDAACGLSRLWSDSTLNAVRNHLSTLDEPLAGILADRDTARDRTHVHTWRPASPTETNNIADRDVGGGGGGRVVHASSRVIEGRIVSNPLSPHHSKEEEDERLEALSRKMASFGDVPTTVVEHRPMHRDEMEPIPTTALKRRVPQSKSEGMLEAFPLPLSSPTSPLSSHTGSQVQSPNSAESSHSLSLPPSSIERANTSPEIRAEGAPVTPTMARARTASGNTHSASFSESPTLLSKSVSGGAGGGGGPSTRSTNVTPRPESANTYNSPPSSTVARNTSPFQSFSPFGGLDWKSGFGKLFFGCAPGSGGNQDTSQALFQTNHFNPLKPLLFSPDSSSSLSSSSSSTVTSDANDTAEIRREEDWIRRHTFRVLESRTVNTEGGSNGGGGGVGPEWLATVAGYPGSTIANAVSESLAAAGDVVHPVTPQPEVVPGRAPGKAEWFEKGRDFFSTFWPAPLQQSLFVCPTRTCPSSNTLPRVASVAGLTMPRRTYWSFNREARVLKRLLTTSPIGDDIRSDTSSTTWALCFEDSTYHGDFTSTLHDALHRHPSINSLSFRGGTRSTTAHDSNTTCLAYLIQDLPQSIRHVTFDDVLSRDALQLLGVVLQARRKTPVENPSSQVSSSGHNHNASGCLQLSGLAVRNHSHLRLEDLTSLLEVLEMGDGSYSPPSEQGESLETSITPHDDIKIDEDEFKRLIDTIPSKLSIEQCEVFLSEHFEHQKLDFASFEAFRDHNRFITKEQFLVANHIYYKNWQSIQFEKLKHRKANKLSSSLPSSLQTPSPPSPSSSSLMKAPPSQGLLWLDLSGNKLHDAGVAAVALACRGCYNLRGLDLSNNGNMGNAPQLSEALVKTKRGLLRVAPNLEVLLLHNNGLYNKGVLKLFAYMGAVSPLLGEIGGSGSFSEMSDPTDQHSPQSLQKGNASSNHFDSKFASKIKGSPHLKSWENDSMIFPSQYKSHLRELGLDHNSLYWSGSGGSDLLLNLKNLLAHNNCLRVLSLAHNKLGENGGREVMKGLLLNSSLEHTDITGCLHVLRLDGNGVDHDSLGMIEDMLRKNRQAFAKELDINKKTSLLASMNESLNNNQSNSLSSRVSFSQLDSKEKRVGSVGSGIGTVMASSHHDSTGGGSEVPSKSKSMGHVDLTKAIHGYPPQHASHLTQPLPVAVPSPQTASASSLSASSDMDHHNHNHHHNVSESRQRRAKSDPPAFVVETAPLSTAIEALEDDSPPRDTKPISSSHKPTSSLSSKTTTHKSQQQQFNKVHNNNNNGDYFIQKSSADMDMCEEFGGSGLNFSVLFSAPLAWRDGRGTLTPIPMLDHEAERDMLRQTFREARRKIRLDFAFATTERLRSMVTLGCQALHFSGHGHPRCLTFEDGAGGLQAVDHERLRSLCAAGGTSGNVLRFVFVSACHSHLSGQAFADAGVAHVVCVKKEAEVLDSAALSFTRAFYLALAVGRTVADSFTIGREAVAASPHVDAQRGKTESGKFLLLPTVTDPNDRRHHVPIFGVGAESKQPHPLSNQIARSSRLGVIDGPLCPMPPEDFIGREADMWRLINFLTVRRLVTVLGPTGCGKSSTVAAVCQYLSAREFFPHGVLYVRVRNRGTTLSKLLCRIEVAIREQAAAAQAADKRAHSCGVFNNDILQMLPPLPPRHVEGEEFDSESRRSWVLQALRGRTSLLVIDQADYLAHQGNSNAQSLRESLRASFTGGVEGELDEVYDDDSGGVDQLDEELDEHQVNDIRIDDLENDNLKTFLDDLFDSARSIKILLASSGDRPLLGNGIGGSGGVVEAIVPLGGLNLRDSVRLFCRLSPRLRTAREREQCLSFLVPPELSNNNSNSTNSKGALTSLKRGSRLLEALGNGMPGRIVHVALAESSLDLLMGIAKNTTQIEKQNETLSTNTSTSSTTSSSGSSGGHVMPPLSVTTNNNNTTQPPPLSPLSQTPSPRRSQQSPTAQSSSVSGGAAEEPPTPPPISPLRQYEGSELRRQRNVDLEDLPH